MKIDMRANGISKTVRRIKEKVGQRIPDIEADATDPTGI